MPTGTLPKSGKKIFEKVYKEALKGSCNGDQQCAAQTAWKAVKNAGWKKMDGKWTKKAMGDDYLAEMSMYITKSMMDGKVMKWQAINSDTDWDSYVEKMSAELYENFIANINNGVPVPEEFKSICSEYWSGGMPYLSVSHYPDLNGQAVPGKPLEIFIDGNRLRAKGILFDSPLGHSVYRSLKDDKYKSPEERIRISIGFIDLAHRHGEDGQLWERKSRYSLCPQCLEGIGQKIYVKGYLVHLALTRVPVNKRTEMVLEEKAEMGKKTTRKEDAESIVGKALADEIELKQKTTAQRSDALIEMSDAEPSAEETQELIKEAESLVGEEEGEVDTVSTSVNDDEAQTEGEEDSEEELVVESEVEKAKRKDVTPADKKRAEKEYGDVAYADPENKKYPIDTEEHIRAAWNYIHQEKNAAKYADKGAAIKKKILAAWKKVIGGAPPSAEKKSDVEEKFEDSTMDNATAPEMPMMENMPYGGATSMQEAQDYVAAKQEAIYLMDMWNVFCNVIWNIMDRMDVPDKRASLTQAVDEFKNVLTAKAMVAFGMTEKSATLEEVKTHELQPTLDALLTVVDNSVVLESDMQRAEQINPALQELGTAIMDYLAKKSIKAIEPPAPDKNDELVETMKSLIQPLVENVQQLTAKVGVLESKSNAQSVDVRPRIPAPRTVTISPNLVAKSEPKVKPGSLRDIMNKSVGLVE